MTPFEVLGVSEAATDEEIRAAYRAKAAKAHPDRGGDPVWFRALRVAYEAIETEDKRRAWRAGGAPGGGLGDMFRSLDDTRARLADRAEKAADLLDRFLKLLS